MNYLTRDDLLDLHAYAIARYGGRQGVKSQDRLEQVVQAPRQVLFGAELYPDLASKTAILVYLLIKHRPFVGGNEATALLALLRSLTLNHGALRPEIGSSELFWLLRALNYSDMDKDGLEQWLRESLLVTASEV
jgi:death on curing protein